MQPLFEGGDYSRMASIQRNTVCHNTTKVRRVSADTGSVQPMEVL